MNDPTTLDTSTVPAPKAAPAVQPKSVPKAPAKSATRSVPKAVTKVAVKSVRKPTLKTAARVKPIFTVAKAISPVKPLSKTVTLSTPNQIENVKKPKLVRDSFTIPKIEYGVLDGLKARAVKLAQPTKKSELLRAGIKALAAMEDSAFLAALKAVPAVKTGRPKN